MMSSNEEEELPDMFTEALPTSQDVWEALKVNPRLEEESVAASCQLVYPAGIILRMPVEALLRALIIFNRGVIMWPFTSEEEQVNNDELSIRNNVAARAAASLYLAAKTVTGCTPELGASPQAVSLAVGHLCEANNGRESTIKPYFQWNRPSSSAILQAEPRILAALGYDMSSGRASAVTLAIAYCAMIGLCVDVDVGDKEKAERQQEKEQGRRSRDMVGRVVGRILEAAAGSLWATGIHSGRTLACAAIESVVGEDSICGGGGIRDGDDESLMVCRGWWRVFDVRDAELEHCAGHIASSRARVESICRAAGC
ncbi:uncharacterized protein SAPINGB_P003458 [Magnusiomyces paraingens]|uniref:Cyclin N-terminal domain-containing protein n=1 Tax=Magnusiomyces paraingens TaxID=2606893 RepID=A0A5E8BRT9_9ASCO|nr:uncharacterized protein SAPINGB_P003458 [Saprochaete ingens]VVT53209.1 unnamed protein product [Saprochaete ingens]